MRMTMELKCNLNDLLNRLDNNANKKLIIFESNVEMDKYKSMITNYEENYIFITQEDLQHMGALNGLKFVDYYFV